MRTEAAFSFPTPVRFGTDVLDEIESDLRRFQIKRPLVVCDNSYQKPMLLACLKMR